MMRTALLKGAKKDAQNSLKGFETACYESGSCKIGLIKRCMGMMGLVASRLILFFLTRVEIHDI